MAHLGNQERIVDIAYQERKDPLVKEESLSSENLVDSTKSFSITENLLVEQPPFFMSDQTKVVKRPFELPSFMNSLWGGPTAGMSLIETRYSNIDTVQTSLEFNQTLAKKSTNLAKCRKSSLKVKTKSTDNLKRNRSESSLPLLFLEENETLVLPVNSDSDESNVSDKRTPHAPPLKVKRKADSSTSSACTSSPSTIKAKYECRHCKGEEEKRKKKWQDTLKEKEKKLFSKSNASKSAKERKETLQPQGSLDSAKDKEKKYSDWPGISKSSSLDIETTSKIQEIISKDGALSTSQDSLQSDVGGAPTLHRYYHVFKEGELDKLIEKYVHNLHIISSYYDHANWCIIAEKVQVWTI